ncbi:hypothetical protein VIGAN_11121700, partial [Vigna angularis var. angularis]
HSIVERIRALQELVPSVNKDIVAKLFSFSQQRPRALCSLTKIGTVSSITLRQPASTSISVSYEARLGGH